jgi:hypothetical protein
MNEIFRPLLLALALIGGASASAGTIPLDHYAQVLVGTWTLSRDTYHFKPDGTFSDTPLYGDSAVTGTWKVVGKKLLMTSGNRTDDPTIRFTSPDQCEWEYANHRVFLANRVKR